MKKSIYYLFGLILLPYFIQAKGLEYARVSIVPEYEMNNFVLFISGSTDSLGMDGPLQFTIPAETDSLMQIIFKGENDVDITKYPFEKRNNKGWVQLDAIKGQFAFMAVTSHIHAPGKRDYSYPMEFNQPIHTLTLEIQEPPMATQFHSSEIDAEIENDPHGQKIHRINIHKYVPNTTKTIHVSYVNERGITTKEMLQEMMGNPSSGTQNIEAPFREPIKRHSLYLWQPIVIVLSLGFIIGFLFINQKNINESLKCPSCNNPISRDDSFCSHCGEKLS